MGDEAQPFSHNGIDHNYDGTPQSIIKLTTAGGIITELETADVGGGTEGVTVTIDPPGQSLIKLKKLVVVDGLITELET